MLWEFLRRECWCSWERGIEGAKGREFGRAQVESGVNAPTAAAAEVLFIVPGYLGM
jgi:hypothetical protein